MTDLIERLNDFVEHLVPVPEYAEEAATVAEAASELSRLQSALQVAEERIGVLTKQNCKLRDYANMRDTQVFELAGALSHLREETK